MSEEYEAVVVGGGITGLCAGFYLQRRLGADKVLVLEAAEEAGGTARTSRESGYVLEHGPNGFLDKEPLTLAWMDDLGIGNALLRADEAAAHRFVLRHGRLNEIKPPPAFLASPLLSLRGRARLVCEPFFPQRRDTAPESIWDFAARRIGREAADAMVSPMVTGIFGGDAKQLSLAHCFPRMAEMERAHGSLLKALRAKRKESAGASPMGPKGTLTCHPDGIGAVTGKAAEHLGPQLRHGAAVSAIEQTEPGYAVTLQRGDRLTAKRVVIAAPAYAAASFCAPLHTAMADTLRSIPYAGIAVACTAHDATQIGRDVNGFGFLVPRVEGPRILGCLWSSSIFPAHAPAGKVLLRTMIGGATDPEAVQLSDDAIADLLRRDLYPLMGITGEPELTRIFRWERGIPQYDLQHGDRLAALDAAEDELPGFALAGNAYRGVGLNDCVVSAHRAVERVLSPAAFRD